MRTRCNMNSFPVSSGVSVLSLGMFYSSEVLHDRSLQTVLINVLFMERHCFRTISTLCMAW